MSEEKKLMLEMEKALSALIKKYDKLKKDGKYDFEEHKKEAIELFKKFQRKVKKRKKGWKKKKLRNG